MTDAGAIQESAWIEVIAKMEEVYSDLIQYEIDLEEKNAALEEAQRFIGSVLSSITDILVVCGRSGEIQQVNLAFLKLTGLAEADLLGRPVAEFLAVDVEQMPLCGWLGSAEGGTREVRFQTSGGGASEPVELACATRFDHRGLPAGVVLSGRPVGDLRRAFDALSAAQVRLVRQEKMASLGRLVAGVAHEINNPVSFVVGNVHALAKYARRLDDYLAAVHAGRQNARCRALRRDLGIDALLADLPGLIEGTMEGAGRVADIVASLKRLSFTDKGPPEVVDLSQLIRNAVQWAVRDRLVRVDAAVPDRVVIRSHAGPLHQVVVNLLDNALDAVSLIPEPIVYVTLSSLDKKVTFKVEDNGSGILSENLPNLFDPFFTTKTVGQGTGLGLWIVEGIVKDLGGTIEVYNRPAGGAAFVVSLPA